MKRPDEELFNLPPKLLSPTQTFIRHLFKLHRCKQTAYESNIITVPHTSNPHTIHLEDISAPLAGFSSLLIP